MKCEQLNQFLCGRQEPALFSPPNWYSQQGSCSRLAPYYALVYVLGVQVYYVSLLSLLKESEVNVRMMVQRCSDFVLSSEKLCKLSMISVRCSRLSKISHGINQVHQYF